MPKKGRDEIRSLQDVAFVKSASVVSDLPTTGLPEVALAGRSNVGKSSIVNLLAGRKNLAKSSSTPGKTRTFNFYSVAETWYLVDLPGFGFAKVSKSERDRWARVITSYLESRDSLKLVLHLIDSRHPPADIDLSIIESMRGGWMPYAIVLTKSDKLSGNERSRSRARVQKELRERGMENKVILSSALDGRGKEELIGWIETFVS